MSRIEGWESEALGKVAQLTMGQSPESKYYSEEENGLPFLQGCAEFQARFPKHMAFCSQTKKVAHAGSILFSVRAPVGKINIADRAYIIGRGLAAILGIDVDQAYLEHYLIFKGPSLRNASQGSTFEAINSSELSNWMVNYPTSKLEQSKIAEVLSTVDRAIEQTEALIAKQQRIKTGLMQDLLTRGIDEHGNLRSEETHEFKDSLLGRMPVGWDIAPVSKYGPRDRTFLRTGPFGSDLNTRHWTDYGIPVLTIGSLGEGIVTETELLFVAESTARALESFSVSSGDIVFSRVADIGRSLVVKEHQDGWIISSNLMRISLDTTKARPGFLYRNIAYNSTIRAQLRTTSNSGGRDLVNGPILSSLVFPWPDVNEQDRINEKIDLIDAESRVSQQHLQELHRVMAGLMQDLLTGKKRVTPLLEADATHTASRLELVERGEAR